MRFKLLTIMLLSLFLTGCIHTPAATEPATDPTEASTETTAPETETEETKPLHSALYLPSVDVEDVIRYFNEVCLDAEFSNAGNPQLLQKWNRVIRYSLQGDYTDEDLAVLKGFVDWLNSIPGFPGMEQIDDSMLANMRIHFCTQQQLVDILGSNFYGMDGGVTFWYTGDNAIYDAVICYRKDMGQYVRNSVILEEIYNGLGPVQDTRLREDSIIYQGYSEPQALTEIDELILKLLYHPEMRCGMDRAACEAVIRQLYY